MDIVHLFSVYSLFNVTDKNYTRGFLSLYMYRVVMSLQTQECMVKRYNNMNMKAILY